MTRQADVLKSFQAYLRQVAIGEAIYHQNLTLFPLLGGDEENPAYVLLGPAIESGQAEVTEVSESGSVPELVVINHGDLPILIPEGEILVGAKQNRVVNITLLVAAHSKVILPVSCVEQGRWSFSSRRFRCGSYAHPTLRRKKTSSVHRKREATGMPFSDQGEVWDEVAEFHMNLGVSSPTDSLTDSFKAAEEEVKDQRKRFELPKNAAGFIVARGEQILGLDLFDSPATLQQLWERLADGYLMESLRDRRKLAETKREIVQRFLERLPECARPYDKAIGLGTELRLESEDVIGSGLWYNDKVCHLSAFANVKA